MREDKYSESTQTTTMLQCWKMDNTKLDTGPYARIFLHFDLKHHLSINTTCDEIGHYVKKQKCVAKAQ